MSGCRGGSGSRTPSLSGEATLVYRGQFGELPGAAAIGPPGSAKLVGKPS